MLSVCGMCQKPNDNRIVGLAKEHKCQCIPAFRRGNTLTIDMIHKMMDKMQNSHPNRMSFAKEYENKPYGWEIPQKIPYPWSDITVPFEGFRANNHKDKGISLGNQEVWERIKKNRREVDNE